MKVKKIKSYFNLLSVLCLEIQNQPDKILDVYYVLRMVLDRGNKILVFGNGGSASDAEHFVGELVGRFIKERKGLPAIALTTNSASITAISNDYFYEDVFSRQVEALAKEGDLVLGISTSGNSENVFRGIMKAKEIGCCTVGLLGKDGGKIKRIVDYSIVVDAEETYHIQEIHIAFLHLLCKFIDEE